MHTLVVIRKLPVLKIICSFSSKYFSGYRCDINDGGSLSFDLLRFINRASSEAVDKIERVLEVIMSRISVSFSDLQVSPNIDNAVSASEKKSKDSKNLTTLACTSRETEYPPVRLGDVQINY